MKRERVAVSRCLLGQNCKYSGQNNASLEAAAFVKERDVLLICPEELGGLPTPREPAEIVEENGGRKVFSRDGRDVTLQFEAGAREALRLAKEAGVKSALLKSGSPSCGKGAVYDGTFTGTLREGNGLTAALFLENGIEVLTEKELSSRGEKPSCTASALLEGMMAHNRGDVMRIHHSLKVYALARAIGEGEGLDDWTQETLEFAAILHDVGIRPSLEKYGSSAGTYQELEGPAAALSILQGFSMEERQLRRVCYLIGRHHTYRDIDGLDYQILVEADFLVNLQEDGIGHREAQRVREKIFRTKTGLSYFSLIYGGEADEQ